MRIGVVPESLWERIVLWLGLVPTPLAETQAAFLHARAIMAGVELDVFEALSDGPAPAESVAAVCRTDPAATKKLLDALVAARYLRSTSEGYCLTSVSRRWLLADSPRSIRSKIGFELDEWAFAEELTPFVRSGEPIHLHERLSPEGWDRYQRGMRDLARLSAPEVAWRVPAPRRAGTLIDLGGAHGLYAAALCARHPSLEATVIDLPEAVSASEPLLDGVPGAERVRYRAEDVVTADLGTEVADVVLMANLAHHLSEEENHGLALRVAQALRPGGTFAVLEWVRPAEGQRTPRTGFGPLLGLYFALTSRSGTWSAEEVAGWQHAAGLHPERPRWLHTLPGTALLSATKPS